MTQLSWQLLSSSNFKFMEYIIDAKNKKLGRLATQVATILQGKHKATYRPNLSGEDVVIIKNVTQITVSGRKDTQKVYYRHAGKLGHLKERKYANVVEKDPTWAIRNAVRLMLPKNKLNAKRMRRLKFQ